MFQAPIFCVSGMYVISTMYITGTVLLSARYLTGMHTLSARYVPGTPCVPGLYVSSMYVYCNGMEYILIKYKVTSHFIIQVT